MSGILFWLCAAFIAYVYAGYPLVAWLLARLFPRSVRSEAVTPSVTLLVAAYNEEDTIGQKIDNSLECDYPREQLQILIAVDGEEDRTRQIVEERAGQGVEISFRPQRSGKINAINRSVAQARGEVVVISDANAFLAPDALRRLVAPFADPKVGAVSGAKHVLRGDGALSEAEGRYWKYESFIKQQETRLGSCTGVSGEIFAFRRNLFTPAPPGTINDDFFLAMQVLNRGYRVVYAPDAKVYERVSPTAQNEITRRQRIVAGRYQALFQNPDSLPLSRPLLAWQLISHKFFRPLVPFAMLGALAANAAALAWPPAPSALPLLRMEWPWSAILMGLQAAFYGMAWLGGRIRQHSLLGELLYLPTFLVNSNFAALSGLARFASGKQSNRWQRVARRKGTPAGRPG